MRNLTLCGQAETISDLLFSMLSLSFTFKIENFSSRHKLHRSDPPEIEIACFKIDHFMVKSCLLFFKFQMCLESSVPLEYFMC